MDARKPKLVHPLLGYICGMCSDELPYGQIADKVLEAKGYAHDLEAQLAGTVDRVAVLEMALDMAADDAERFTAQEYVETPHASVGAARRVDAG
jgi:hypothetical protein